MTDTELGLQRLDNWARWACGGEFAMILQLWYPKRAAVAGQHLSSEVWDDEPAKMPVNVRDAEIVEKLIVSMAPYLCNAVRHTYTGRPRMINTHDSIIRERVEQAAREIMAKQFHKIS